MYIHSSADYRFLGTHKPAFEPKHVPMVWKYLSEFQLGKAGLKRRAGVFSKSVPSGGMDQNGHKTGGSNASSGRCLASTLGAGQRPLSL